MDSITGHFDDDHERTQTLLPWFVTGRLDAEEHARVAGHVAVCETCRAELAAERRLHASVEGADIDMEIGWARMRQRIEQRADRRGSWRRTRRVMRSILDRPRAAAMVIAAQAALLVAALALPPLLERPPAYHALGAAPTPAAAGNVIVMFGSDARAADMAAALQGAGARIVDGPTETGAYILAVAPARRAAIVAQLRMRPALTLAEPLDP
jgi:hypothetical protein